MAATLDLRVDVAEDKLPEDCFISVRVGETQKLSRIAPTRNYKFPQAGERRYGKIEIYQRLGSCGVDVDPMNAGDRHVTVGCGDRGSIKLAVALNDSGKGNAQAAPPPQTKKNEAVTSKSKAAKEYLRQHSLELQLSEAMQAVLRARPDDPVRFLAERLMENVAKGGVALPAASPVVRKQPSPPCADLSNFKGYYGANFGTVASDSWNKIHSGFAAPARVAAKPAALAASAAAPPKTAFQLRPSVGSWLAPRPKPVTPVPSKAAVFARKPSVGTWLQRLPVAPPQPAKEASSPSSEKQDFKRKPSVGTWLANRLPVKTEKVEPQKAEAEIGTVAASYPYPHCVSSASFGPRFTSLGLAPRMLFI